MISLDRAVRPNLFDVAAEPRLTFVLTLANMMSPRMWEMADTVRHKQPADRMQALHAYVNGHFEHVLPWAVRDQWGVVDLERERERLGADVVDSAVDTITMMFDLRERTGTMPEGADVRPLIETGRFPAYFYATIDEAIACRRLLRHKKHKPLGRTSCLDEAAVIAAALCLFANGIPSELAFLASDFHYSVIELDLDDPVWFNGKKDYFSRSEWHELASERSDHGQTYLDQVMYSVARVVVPSGTFDMVRNTANFPTSEVEHLTSRVSEFLGPELRQSVAMRRSREALAVTESERDRFPDAFTPDGAAALRANVRRIAAEQPRGVCEAALYCYRSMDVADPRPYLLAAERAIHRTPGVDEIRTLDEARARVAAIPGTESILGDRRRIATPDETIHYRTGSDRDLALLLWAYARRLGAGPPDGADLAIEFTETGSYVHVEGDWCDAATGQLVHEPQGEPLATWAAS